MAGLARGERLQIMLTDEEIGGARRLAFRQTNAKPRLRCSRALETRPGGGRRCLGGQAPLAGFRHPRACRTESAGSTPEET